jgi:hypothetical protein
MWKLSLLVGVVAAILLCGNVAQAGRDITGPLDTVKAVPDDGDWPPNEVPRQACDDQILTKYLHFKGGNMPTGIRVTPVAGPTVVTGVTFTTANDSDYRDPITYELSGSNDSIDGPYTLIASGPIKDFAGATAWPRRTKTTTPMRFANTVSYKHYQLLFPTTRTPATEPYMQIAEIELLSDVFVATAPKPANGALGIVMPLLQWTPGDTAVFEDVYVGTTPELTAADRVGNHQSALLKMLYYAKGLVPGQKYYWRVDDFDVTGKVYTGDVWTFSAAPLIAYSPNPLDGDKWLSTGTTLSWLPGQNALSHELYFSTDKNAVLNRDASAFQGKLNAPTFNPGTLTEKTAYYWAVDEVLSAGKNAGELWSFTTVGAGGGLKGEYFNNTTMSGVPGFTRIDPDINFNWGGNGPGAPIGTTGWSARWTADLDIAVADTYTFAITSAGGTRLWIDGKLIIDMWVSWVPTTYGSLPTYLDRGIHSLRVEYANWDRTDAQQILYWERPGAAQAIVPAGPLQPPVRARALYPANGDVNVPQDVTLTWSVGEKAAQHDIYFGDDANAVAAADPSSSLYKGQQQRDENTLAVSNLEWNKTYYWRVDEVNEADADSPWVSSVWSFTTADFLVVDNFETYTIEEGNRIFDLWIDGWATGLNGSMVGYIDPPFTEQAIVHGGAQSMPMDYNNVNSPFYSEAERELSPVQNWTVNGVTDLVLFVRGNAARFVENPAGTYKISANSVDVWGTADNFRFAYKTLNGDGSISAKVISVTNTNAWAKAGVMIRESVDPASSYAFMFPTPDGRRAFQNRPVMGGSAVSAHSATGLVTLPFWVKVERKGNQLTAYYSTDGKNWTKQPDTENTGTDASPNPQTIAMTGSVCIGLAVASNNSRGGTCFATFSDVVTTGSVSGSFKVADVGTIDPGNDPATLYVAIQDSAGKLAVVNNPDAGAVNVLEWTEWKIPLSQFTGVNPAKVKKLYIGMGDRTNPAPDGAGRIYIDDIRVTKP